MKKLLLTALIVAAAGISARAQFFWGLQFGMYSDGLTDTYIETGDSVNGGTSFNYMLKPKIGYYITPKLVTGLSLIFTSNSFKENQSGTSATTLENYLIKLLMGNGLETNALSWKVSPYIKYNFFSICKDKIKFWAELSGYVGTKYPWDKNNRCYLKEESETIYGLAIHPQVSFDIADKWMIFTNVELLSLSWDGATKYTQVILDSGEIVTKRTTSNTFLFQSRPTIAIARLFANIGVIKKF